MADTKRKRTAPQASDLYDAIVLVNELSTAMAELIADHATFKTAVDQIETLIEELHDDHATYKTIVDELKTDHNALLTKLDADGGVTDADYAATHTVAASSPATLTAPKPASAPATLTAPKPASAPATLTAAGTGGDRILNPAGTAFA